MKIFILVLIQIYINFIYSEPKPTEKEIAQAERSVKSLACSILANTHYAYSNTTKRQIRELLKANNIIQKAAESHQKIFEFLRAICYREIEVETANRIVDDLSEKKYDILKDEDYGKLFRIDPNLNFTKIKKVIKRVNKIMKKIVEEQENQNKNETTDNSDKVEGDNLYKFFAFKPLCGILIGLILISISSYFLKNKKNKNIIEVREAETKNENNENKDIENKEKNDIDNNKEEIKEQTKETENNNNKKKEESNFNNDKK